MHVRHETYPEVTVRDLVRAERRPRVESVSGSIKRLREEVERPPEMLQRLDWTARIFGKTQPELMGKTRKPSQQLIDQVGLSGREADFPDRLSGGEQQRVAIARALVEEPVLVLADEPTGNLDRVTGEVVLSMLEELIRARGLTLILATHSHRIAQSADQKWALVDGKLEPDDETPF